jgi:transcriptional regulator with XRE-family HTH domain
LPTNSEIKDWEALGRAIRERRKAQALTLVDLAGKADLSQPFLSQIENGRARPSLMSLHRIAEALDTTPQAFFTGPVGRARKPTVVRAGAGRTVNVDSLRPASSCHLLLSGESPLHVLEFDGLPTEYLDYFEHDGFEATYVIAGRIEVDVDGLLSELGPGDTISYPARMRHRMRSVGRRRARVLLMATTSAPLTKSRSRAKLASGYGGKT